MYYYWQRRLSSDRSFITTAANVWKPSAPSSPTTITTSSTTIIDYTKNLNRRPIKRLFNSLRIICFEIDNSMKSFKLFYTRYVIPMLSSFLVLAFLCCILFVICFVFYMKLRKVLVKKIQHPIIDDSNETATTKTNSILMHKTSSLNKNIQSTSTLQTNNHKTNSVLFYDFYLIPHFNVYVFCFICRFIYQFQMKHLFIILRFHR